MKALALWSVLFLWATAAAQDKSLTLCTSLAPTESRPLAQGDYTVVDQMTVLDEQDKWNRIWEGLFIKGDAKR